MSVRVVSRVEVSPLKRVRVALVPVAERSTMRLRVAPLAPVVLDDTSPWLRETSCWTVWPRAPVPEEWRSRACTEPLSAMRAHKLAAKHKLVVRASGRWAGVEVVDGMVAPGVTVVMGSAACGGTGRAYAKDFLGLALPLLNTEVPRQSITTCDEMRQF